MLDPLSQFALHNILHLNIGGFDVSLTNSGLFMLLAAASVIALMILALRKPDPVPGRLQAAVELLAKMIADMIDTHISPGAQVLFPYVFSLFMFILAGNLLGLLPFGFTFTSHLAVTLGLAIAVVTASVILGIYRHGAAFFRIFWPSGLPGVLAPLLIPVEIMSFLSRPVSLGVRLFANMVSGHIIIKIFISFTTVLADSAILKPLSVVPFILDIILFCFEFMVACLQAYVFTLLSCIYLHDAWETHHH